MSCFKEDVTVNGVLGGNDVRVVRSTSELARFRCVGNDDEVRYIYEGFLVELRDKVEEAFVGFATECCSRSVERVDKRQGRQWGASLGG